MKIEHDCKVGYFDRIVKFGDLFTDIVPCCGKCKNQLMDIFVDETPLKCVTCGSDIDWSNKLN